MRHVLGVLVDRSQFSRSSEFSWLVWDAINNGPSVLRPKRYGNYEPLKPIGDIPPEKVVGGSFFFSNGRKSSGAVFITKRESRRFHNLTLDVETRLADHATAEEVYRWLEATFHFAHCYMCSFTKEKAERHFKELQVVNVGVYEPTLSEALKIRHLFEHFESVT